MAQRVFGRLRGGVGGAGESAEGGYIGEIPSVVLAKIQPPGLCAGGNGVGRRHRLGGNAQAGSEIVGAAVGDIAHGRTLGQCHQAAQRFIQRAVSAGADHQIELTTQLRRRPLGVAGTLGDEQLDKIPRL